jgi:rhomboid protease GluP
MKITSHMKISFTQKHIEQLPLDSISASQFLSLAVAASERLGWVFGNITQTGFVAYTNNGLFAWNAEIKMKIINGLVFIQSQSREEGKDMTGNKKNIQNFISAFESLKYRWSLEEPGLIYENAENGFSHNESVGNVRPGETSSISKINMDIKQIA